MFLTGLKLGSSHLFTFIEITQRLSIILARFCTFAPRKSPECNRAPPLISVGLELGTLLNTLCGKFMAISKLFEISILYQAHLGSLGALFTHP